MATPEVKRDAPGDAAHDALAMCFQGVSRASVHACVSGSPSQREILGSASLLGQPETYSLSHVCATFSARSFRTPIRSRGNYDTCLMTTTDSADDENKHLAYYPNPLKKKGIPSDETLERESTKKRRSRTRGTQLG